MYIIIVFVILVIIVSILLDFEGEGLGLFIPAIICLVFILFAFPFRSFEYTMEPIKLQKIEGKRILKQDENCIIKYNDNIRVINNRDMDIRFSDDSTFTLVQIRLGIRECSKTRSRWVLFAKPGRDTTRTFSKYIHYIQNSNDGFKDGYQEGIQNNISPQHNRINERN